MFEKKSITYKTLITLSYYMGHQPPKKKKKDINQDINSKHNILV